MTLEEGRFLLCIIDDIRGGSVFCCVLLMTLEEGQFFVVYY